jgi:hypothetical protein
MLRGAPHFLGAFWAPLAWGPLAQANEPEVQVVGERAPRASAAAADATLAAERAAAAQAVAGRARQPSLHAFFARTTPAAAQKLRRRTRSFRRTRARCGESSWGAEGEGPTLQAGEQVHGHAWRVQLV